jgi:hypothetical protein
LDVDAFIASSAVSAAFSADLTELSSRNGSTDVRYDID